jgi:D-tyrosyl-tRNA(Tyr) deacylase
MFIGEVHFSSKQLKQARGTHVDAGSCIASYAFLAIEANMRRFIDFEAYQLQALFDWLQIWLLALLE